MLAAWLHSAWLLSHSCTVPANFLLCEGIGDFSLPPFHTTLYSKRVHKHSEKQHVICTVPTSQWQQRYNTLLLTVNSCHKTQNIQRMLTANISETVERCLRLFRWRQARPGHRENQEYSWSTGLWLACWPVSLSLSLFFAFNRLPVSRHRGYLTFQVREAGQANQRPFRPVACEEDKTIGLFRLTPAPTVRINHTDSVWRKGCVTCVCVCVCVCVCGLGEETRLWRLDDGLQPR